MKKIIVFIFILVSITLTMFVKDKQNPLFKCENVYQVCMVVDNGKLVGEVLKCGNKDFVYLSKEDAFKSIGKCQTYAVQFYLEDMDFSKILKILKANIISSQQVSGYEIYYCYTPYEKDCVYLKNKKVNLQVVLKDNEVIAGMPLILTGY